MGRANADPPDVHSFTFASANYRDLRPVVARFW
jgi:hypothetical protein